MLQRQIAGALVRRTELQLAATHDLGRVEDVGADAMGSGAYAVQHAVREIERRHGLVTWLDQAEEVVGLVVRAEEGCESHIFEL